MATEDLFKFLREQTERENKERWERIFGKKKKDKEKDEGDDDESNS